MMSHNSLKYTFEYSHGISNYTNTNVHLDRTIWAKESLYSLVV